MFKNILFFLPIFVIQLRSEPYHENLEDIRNVVDKIRIDSVASFFDRDKSHRNFVEDVTKT